MTINSSPSKKRPLNTGQEAAAQGFFEFLFTADQNELIISGPGGVGKTYLMGVLIDEVMPRYHQSCQLLGITPQYDNVEMTATTNKAAEVLGQATGRPTRTIHSLMNLVVRDNYETGKSKLEKTPNWTVHQRKIIFVDEYTMLGWKARELIQEGTAGCKIIYVGDYCQLEPVADLMSPSTQENLPFFDLTEPMRTDNPHLQALNEQLRETVKTGVFRPIQAVPGVIDWLGDDDMYREIETHFLDKHNHNRILAYTNKRVIEYNDHIRAIRDLPDSLTIGEHVISNSFMPINGIMMHVEDEFLVSSIKLHTEHILIEITPDKKRIELEVLRVTLQGRHATFKDIAIPVDREHFNQLVKWYANQKNWRLYYQLKNNYPDLRPRDACTTHKAQGSTHDTVFIDLKDLGTCRDPNTLARLLYVGGSRARKRLVMYGQLPAKYGGMVL